MRNTSWPSTLGIDWVKTLGTLGRLPELLDLALDVELNWRVRIESADRIAQVGPAQVAADTFRTLAFDFALDARARYRALEGLCKLEQGRDQILALAKNLSQDVWIRGWSTEVLGQVGSVSDLRDLARMPILEGFIRLRAAVALGRRGHPKEAIKVLRELADPTRNSGVETSAALEISHLGERDEAIALLMALVRIGADDAVAGVLRLVRGWRNSDVLLELATNPGISWIQRTASIIMLRMFGRTAEASRAESQARGVRPGGH